jgi:chromatin remodeling complex protein RSC6
MPRQTKDQKANTTAAPAPVAAVAVAPVVEAVPEVVVETKKPKSSRSKKTADATPAAPVEEVVVPTPAPVVPEVVVEESAVADASTEEVTKQSRTLPTRESIMAEFSELSNLLEQQITQLRDTTDKTNNVRFIRSVNKRIRNLQSSVARVLRQKQPSSRKNNNSGFLKPVKISSDMAKFTGLDPVELHSRVDVTKFLCNYIKEHNLQNPEDKRKINADPSLAKLLGYDAKSADKPLTYYHIQSLLKNHFTKSA